MRAERWHRPNGRSRTGANRSIGRCDGGAAGPTMGCVNSALTILLGAAAAIGVLGMVLLIAGGVASMIDHND
jgi:hypothetical protein